jgi:Fe-S cluster assembly protein SufD
MNTVEYYKERFEELRLADPANQLSGLRKDALKMLAASGIPTSKHEEWKYTRVSSLFNKDYVENAGQSVKMNWFL